MSEGAKNIRSFCKCDLLLFTISRVIDENATSRFCNCTYFKHKSQGFVGNSLIGELLSIYYHLSVSKFIGKLFILRLPLIENLPQFGVWQGFLPETAI